jgi:hypothetical protein
MLEIKAMSARHLSRGRRQIRRALCEALESRTLFDLVPTSVTEVPTSLIATVPTTDKVMVDLKNTGTAKISGAYTVKLFASLNQTLDDSDDQIVLVGETLASLSAGSSREISVSLGSFPDVSAGKYYILAEITGSLAGSGDNVVASTSQVSITDPAIDLTSKDVLTGSTTLSPGGSGTVAVTVTNSGNVTATGPLAINLEYSTSSSGSAPTLLTGEDVSINLAAGASKVFDFAVPIAGGTPSGNYYIVTVLDPDNTFHESNTLTNRTAVTSTAITVDEYPNIVGTLTGSFKTTAGPHKGLKGTVTLHVTSESQTTGACLGTITNNFGGDATVMGTISTGGAVQANTKDVGDSGTGSIVGTFSKGTLTGTFTASNGDVSSFTVSLP